MKLLKNAYNFYLLFLGFVVSLPMLAPVFLHIGLNGIANLIYFVYSFFCHQFATRSLYLFDYQYAWCARDTGIWSGMFLAALLVKLRYLKGIKWYVLLLFAIPVALDGGIQTLATLPAIDSLGFFVDMPAYLSNNFFRFVTGFILGFGVALWISPQLLNSGAKEPESVVIKKDTKLLRKVLIISLIAFSFYTALVFLWNVTSTKNLPTNFLDAIPKIQSNFFERRADGPCSTQGPFDLIQVECFFKKPTP